MVVDVPRIGVVGGVGVDVPAVAIPVHVDRAKHGTFLVHEAIYFTADLETPQQGESLLEMLEIVLYIILGYRTPPASCTNFCYFLKIISSLSRKP